MSLCGVSQLFSDEHNECPAECPFWAPSSVWKYIGVCSEVGVCKRFNPILNYADSYNNVCLPCKVFGCISCKYSNEPDSMVPVTDTLKKLPDYCIECAKGYKRSEDGTSCYIVGSTLWSKLFYFILIYLLICIAIVTIRILVNRDKFKSNFRNLVNALKNQQKKLLRDFTSPENRLYKLFTDLTNQNLSGLGLILYFRSLGFLVIVMSLLFFVSLAHVHIPCSNMIRLFKDPFRIYYFARANHVPRSFIANFFAKNANKLVDDIFNFKSVDEAIEWNVTQYSNEISGVMYVLYVSVMVMTVVYFVSQRRAIIKFMSKSSKMRDLTLVIKNLPSSLTDEEQIKEMIYTCTNIRPVTVTVCYDLKREKKLLTTLDQTIEDFNHTSQTNDSYISLDGMEEMNEFFSKLKGSGECFLTFESTNDCRSVLERFHNKEFKLYQCEVEPENIIWENIGYESHVNRKVFGISMVTIAILMAYIVLFFVPYAFYTITSPMTHILEILVLGLFVEFGNILTSLILRNLIDKAGIINREVVDSYLMFCKYFIRLINLFLNVGLSHFINYGGRSKALSFLEHNPYLESPSFKVGEEVSFGLSFSIYVVNVFVLIPNALFLLEHYIIPIVNSFLVLTLDFEPKSASRLMQYSTFSLFSYYSDDMSNLTCCLLLFFLIKDQKQGSLVFLSLLVSYILNYAKSQFILLRRSSRKLYSTWRLSYFTYIMWAFPTLLLAVCPRYWDWRGGEGTIISIFINAVLHIVLYTFIIHIVFSKTSTLDTEITLSEVLEDNFFNGFEMELDYKAHNPVYKFKKFASQYNFF